MIDIIIPAHNREKTIGRTLSSLVAQTDNRFKVIVVDDASTDNTKAVVDSYKNLLDITYIRNETNLGQGMTRQAGIDNSNSEFITFLDSDDLFMPYTIETFNSIIKNNPDLEFLHTHFYEQVLIEDEMMMILEEDNFTALHGKLYNRKILEKFNIRFIPELSRFSEDGYFNCLCSELMEITISKLPSMIWVYTDNSWMRSEDKYRDENSVKYFIRALELSNKFIKQFKPKVSHLNTTITSALSRQELTEDERQQLENILKEETENVL